jgi:hypothetical protein
MRPHEAWEAEMIAKLEPIYVPADDIDQFGVEEEGWYVIDDNRTVFDGPFDSRPACLKAIAAAEQVG